MTQNENIAIVDVDRFHIQRHIIWYDLSCAILIVAHVFMLNSLLLNCFSIAIQLFMADFFSHLKFLHLHRIPPSCLLLRDASVQ